MKILFELDNSIIFIEDEKCILKMKRNAEFGIITGEIFNESDESIMKLKTSFFSKTKIIENNTNFNFKKLNWLLFDTFIVNENRLTIFNFILPIGRIWLNGKLIGKIRYQNFFKYMPEFYIDFQAKSRDEIYLSSLIYCTTLLSTNLY